MKGDKRTLPLDFQKAPTVSTPAPARAVDSGPLPPQRPYEEPPPEPLTPDGLEPSLAAILEELPFYLDEGPPPARPRAPTPSALAPALNRPPAPAADAEEAISVGALGRMTKRALDDRFLRPVWAYGEITNARPAPRGHLYFTLKDEEEEATVDVVIYKTSLTPRMRDRVKDGARVKLRGRMTYWAPRGRTQFVADRVEPRGAGALLEALARLKEKLQAEGLFDPARKKPLPRSPRIVGVVTSRTGAVIHDIRNVAFRRGGAHILLAPATVQGPTAAESVRRALAALCTVKGVDVIIVGRGGGSSDDLMAFNDEALVRAVAGCAVPVVSAVGHEVDVTLTDFAADARAATPSQAAELVVPDRAAVRALFRERHGRLERAMHQQVARRRLLLGRIERKLGDPRLGLAAHQQRVDELRGRLETALGRAMTRRGRATQALRARLLARHPGRVLAQQRSFVDGALLRLQAAQRRSLARAHARLGKASAQLDALSPLKVLARGYSITLDGDGKALRRADHVAKGDPLRILLEEGELRATVESVVAPTKAGEP